MIFLTHGEIHNRMRKLQGMMPFVKSSLDIIIQDRDAARTNEIRRQQIDKWAKELDEYELLFKLKAKLDAAESKGVDCECCGYIGLKKACISIDGNHFIGSECYDHYDGSNPCNLFNTVVIQQ